jgi:predicted GH43/DUF377 family glycosyl hydrolase
MWYSSGTDWVEVDRKLEHVYVIKHAISSDAVRWTRENRQILQALRPNESQTRPAILRLNDRWHMWFSYRGSLDFRGRGETYRIGLARSDDLRSWSRSDDEAGIEPSANGWDSQMVCYPEVVSVDERILMFYNGNGFGESGFGFAVLER